MFEGCQAARQLGLAGERRLDVLLTEHGEDAVGLVVLSGDADQPELGQAAQERGGAGRVLGRRAQHREARRELARAGAVAHEQQRRHQEHVVLASARRFGRPHARSIRLLRAQGAAATGIDPTSDAGDRSGAVIVCCAWP